VIALVLLGEHALVKAPRHDPGGQAMQLITRRRTLAALGGAMATGVLAACRSATQPAAQGTSQAIVAPTTIEHLDWWTPDSNPIHGTYFDGLAKEITERYPQLTVKYNFPSGGTGGVREKWIVLSAAGTPVDTSQVSVAFVRYLMEADLMEPLDAYQAKTPHMAASNFVDSGRFSTLYQGKTYGIPYDGPAMNVVGINTDHFREVGLNPSRDFTWKWTTEQFVDAARRLVKRDGDTVTRGGFTPMGWGVESYCRWLYPFGGDFYSGDYKRVLFNSQQGRDTLQFMVDLRHKFGIANLTQGATLDNEQYSMANDGSWTAGYHVAQNPNLKFDYAPFPGGPQGKPGGVTWTNMWAMARGSTKKDAAWLWMSYVNSEPTLERWFAAHYKRTSGRKEFYQSAAWREVTRAYPALVDIEKLFDQYKQYPWVKNAELDRETGDLGRAAINNEMAVNDALSQIEQIANRLLAQA
jgi:ABC-type glycerol-3-phosphate transport system substrate-binding protein